MRWNNDTQQRATGRHTPNFVDQKLRVGVQMGVKEQGISFSDPALELFPVVGIVHGEVRVVLLDDEIDCHVVSDCFEVLQETERVGNVLENVKGIGQIKVCVVGKMLHVVNFGRSAALLQAPL